MVRSKGRTGRPWLRARARIIAQGLPCWICGHPIDYTLPYRNPLTGRINRWSVTIDHLTPLSMGGPARDLNNLAAAHLHCNLRRGDGTTPAPAPVTSRAW